VSYDEMSTDEWQSFLRAPVRPAMLATTRADGRPHLVPVWYDVDDDGSVMFNTGETSVKGRNMRRDPRVALCVQDDQPPFSFVTITGTAELIDDLDEVRAWAGRIGGRYMGADRAEEYGDRNGVPGELIIRLRPANVVAYRDVAN
jgi:PPOX class probable F420-dependent enzyme